MKTKIIILIIVLIFGLLLGAIAGGCVIFIEPTDTANYANAIANIAPPLEPLR